MCAPVSCPPGPPSLNQAGVQMLWLISCNCNCNVTIESLHLPQICCQRLPVPLKVLLQKRCKRASMRIEERCRIPNGASLCYRISLFTSCNCNVLHVCRHTSLRPSMELGPPRQYDSNFYEAAHKLIKTAYR